ncbi:MAG: hypothetical protein SFT93_01765 [Rickettsiaceae bacterium]|nr:hypothetical protein [Rickettsiaceae bacterium]
MGVQVPPSAPNQILLDKNRQVAKLISTSKMQVDFKTRKSGSIDIHKDQSVSSGLTKS